MNINEKVYRRKSPEALALENTVARYILFLDKNLEATAERELTQSFIDLELEKKAQELAYVEDRDMKMKGYVS